MSRKTTKVGAFASAAMMFAALFAFDVTGANAQDEMMDRSASEAASEQVGSAPVAETPQMALRFVASAVVQELPESVDEALPATSNAASLIELVAGTSASDEMSEDLGCLARAVYFESRGEPLAGQLAVARVIVNRSASPLFPDDYCSVVTQKSQFSFVKGDRIPSPNTASNAWAQAKKIARIAHQGLWASAVDDALFFHAEHVRPRWASHKSARATIDSHIFYR